MKDLRSKGPGNVLCEGHWGLPPPVGTAAVLEDLHGGVETDATHTNEGHTETANAVAIHVVVEHQLYVNRESKCMKHT